MTKTRINDHRKKSKWFEQCSVQMWHTIRMKIWRIWTADSAQKWNWKQHQIEFYLHTMPYEMQKMHPGRTKTRTRKCKQWLIRGAFAQCKFPFKIQYSNGKQSFEKYPIYTICHTACLIWTLHRQKMQNREKGNFSPHILCPCYIGSRKCCI